MSVGGFFFKRDSLPKNGYSVIIYLRLNKTFYECLNVLQTFFLFVFLGYMDIKGTLNLISLQKLMERFFYVLWTFWIRNI